MEEEIRISCARTKCQFLALHASRKSIYPPSEKLTRALIAAKQPSKNS